MNPTHKMIKRGWIPPLLRVQRDVYHMSATKKNRTVSKKNCGDKPKGSDTTSHGTNLFLNLGELQSQAKRNIASVVDRPTTRQDSFMHETKTLREKMFSFFFVFE
ncbi:hypothetical protein CEXT_517921 [Caerostris extrusa]|uniref:Uncharacterized protein n=1 Tax=Caerostris extrusa TaxID=172846 RepID=A0AAV4SIG1_CAEEX|nr:hypothetical protein CEXT_517921 [Caerostris extrusa]